MIPGDKLGPYEILAPIGAGGMGEVYRARDTKLKRDVALKVLPDAFAGDPERMARFQREAEVLAALNHPNIAAIYGVEDHALVMELVEGESPKGPLPFDEAWHIASQIAAALEYAHDRGIVHRDLKPANIKITPDGMVKLLDFGLAKAFTSHRDSAAPAGENSPTLTMGATEVGVILGTAAYMSPEQAKGKQVDKRADIWAFGVILYELVTGKRPFAGETTTDLFASIVKEQPDWNQVPAKAQRLLEKCVEKDLSRRLRDIGDAKHLLVDTSPVPRVARSVPWMIVAGIFLATTLGISVVHFRSPHPGIQIVRSAIIPPDKTNLNFDANLSGPLAFSPDGRRIAFGARTSDGKRKLWIRALDSLVAQPLPGSEGATNVFWSPDTRYVGFFADQRLKKIDVSGGSPLTLCDAPIGEGGTWNRDGVIVFAPNRSGPLFRISASGGTPTPVTALDGGRAETAHRWPWFLPDGRHFLYAAGNAPGAAGSVGSIRVASIDSNGRDSKVLVESDFNAAYAQGYLLYMRESILMAQSFDLRRLVTVGDALPLAEQVRMVSIPQFRAAFSVSENGMLVYRKDNLAGANQLTWLDRTGTRIATVGQPAVFGDVRISPNGKSAAATIGNSVASSRGVWLYDLTRGFATRFSSDSAVERDPIWFADGRMIVFTSNRRGHFDIYQKMSDGVGKPELLYADDLEKYPTSISPDGSLLLYYTLDNPRGANHIWVLPLHGERKPFALTEGNFNQSSGQFSPDGRWISYASNESGVFEVYVSPFPSRGGKQRISEAGGSEPRWRRDGKEIFYLAPGGRLVSVEVNVKGPVLDLSDTRPLFDSVPSAPGYSYDVSADGQRFLVISAPEQNSSEPLTLVQNWTAALK